MAERCVSPGTWRVIHNPDTGKYRLCQSRIRTVRAQGGRVYPKIQPFTASGMADAVVQAKLLLLALGVGQEEGEQCNTPAGSGQTRS